MADITLKGNPFHTSGNLPTIGSAAPNFHLVNQSLAPVSLADYPGKKILNIYPSIDTPVCALSVKQFHATIGEMDQITVLNISLDLPFAAKRFCGAEGIDNAETLSAFRSTFADDYGVKIVDGPLQGLCARAIVILDESNTVVYTELVPEIGQEPNYEHALSAAKDATTTA